MTEVTVQPHDGSDRIGMLHIAGLDIPWHDLDETSSTMDYASAITPDGGGWIAVSARTQRAGRGTRGREWHSFPGKGLWVSIVMPPPAEPELMSSLTVCAAAALAFVLARHTGLEFQIKQPNDVIRKGRKIAGILIESVTRGSEVVSVVLGMGVNLEETIEDFIAAGLPDATSVLIESGIHIDRRVLLESFLERFYPLYVGRGIMNGLDVGASKTGDSA